MFEESLTRWSQADPRRFYTFCGWVLSDNLSVSDEDHLACQHWLGVTRIKGQEKNLSLPGPVWDIASSFCDIARSCWVLFVTSPGPVHDMPGLACDTPGPVDNMPGLVCDIAGSFSWHARSCLWHNGSCLRHVPNSNISKTWRHFLIFCVVLFRWVTIHVNFHSFRHPPPLNDPCKEKRSSFDSDCKTSANLLLSKVIQLDWPAKH